MVSAVFCIVPLLFTLGSCTNVVDSVVSNAVNAVTDFLSITNATFASLDFVALAAEDGYSATAHNVTTEDGYIITIFRLTGNDCSTDGRPVMLQHGFGMTADTWLDAGVNASLAYLLADDCYDLWVGNYRGTYYGRAHTTLNPDSDAEFWEYALHEYGYYDLTAMIDYILDTTGYDKLDYVGYSHGAGTFYIMASERPEYNDKVNVHVALAPATRLPYLTSLLFNLVTSSSAVFNLLPQQGSLREIFYRGSAVQTLYKTRCVLADVLSPTYDACEAIMTLLEAGNPNSITAKTYSRLSYHFITGASVKLVTHYYQLKFVYSYTKYDYGSAKNLKLYGTEIAPSYNMSAVTVPALILYGLNDHASDGNDTNWLQGQLPNLIGYVAINDSLWNHLDFPLSQFIPTHLYPLINECLVSYNI